MVRSSLNDCLNTWLRELGCCVSGDKMFKKVSKNVLKLSFRQNFISNNRSLVKGKLNVTALRPKTTKTVVAVASTKRGVISQDNKYFRPL